MNLGEWYKRTKKVLGRKSAATVYLKKLIKKSPNGRKEQMIVDDFQVELTLWSIHSRGLEEENFDFIDKLIEKETIYFLMSESLINVN